MSVNWFCARKWNEYQENVSRAVLRVGMPMQCLPGASSCAGGIRSPRGTKDVLRDTLQFEKAYCREAKNMSRAASEKCENFVAIPHNGSMITYPRLAPALVSAKEKRACCFARDKLFYATTAGSKQYVVSSRNDLYHLLRRSTASMQCYYEVLDATLPSRFYMDIEFARPSKDDGSTIEANLKQYFPRDSESAVVSGCERRLNIVQSDIVMLTVYSVRKLCMPL